MNRSSKLGCSALVLLAFAGAPAFAQQTVEGQPLKGGFDKPLKAPKAGQSNSKFVMSMSEDDGENKYSVRIEGDDVSAKINGEEIPDNRIKREDGKIIILNEDGQPLKEFAIGHHGQGAFGMSVPGTPIPGGQVKIRRFGNGDNQNAFTITPQEGVAGAWSRTEPPKVMLGITMSSSDESGVVVDSVVDGLPAEKAGIQEGDRLVSIDGEEIDDATTIREILAEKKPGDDIKVELVRDGESKTITVKLAKFEQGKLGAAVAPMPGMNLRMDNHNPFGGAREELEKTLRRLSDDPELKNAFRTDEARNQIRESLERAIASLEEAQHAMGDGMAWLLEERMAPGGQQGTLFDKSTPGMVFRVPPTPEAPRALSSETDARLEKLMKKLEKLDARLDDLEKKIDNGKN